MLIMSLLLTVFLLIMSLLLTVVIMLDNRSLDLFLVSISNFVSVDQHYPTHLSVPVTTVLILLLGIQLFWIPHWREIMWRLPFCPWLISLNTRCSRFINLEESFLIFYTLLLCRVSS